MSGILERFIIISEDNSSSKLLCQSVFASVDENRDGILNPVVGGGGVGIAGEGFMYSSCGEKRCAIQPERA